MRALSRPIATSPNSASSARRCTRPMSASRSPISRSSSRSTKPSSTAFLTANEWNAAPVFRVSAAHWAASGMPRIVIVETIGYVISWVAFPLLVLPLARYLGRENRFIPFVVAYNWSQIPQTALFLMVGADTAAGLFPSGVAQIVDFAAAVAVLVYEWYIARVALQVSTSQAVPVVLLDVVLGVVLSRITEGLY